MYFYKHVDTFVLPLVGVLSTFATHVTPEASTHLKTNHSYWELVLVQPLIK